MRVLLGITLLAALSPVLSGCGYALAGRGSFLPADIRIVGIPLLENRTNVPRIDQIFTEKVRTAFIDRGSGKYDIRPTVAGTQAVLSGAILSIRADPVGITNQQLASRYLYTVTMRVQFTDARTGQVLWSNEALTFREEYDAQTRSNTQLEGAVLLEQEGPALNRLGDDLARSVVTAILEAF